MSFFSWFTRKPSAQRRPPQPSAAPHTGPGPSQSGRTHKPGPLAPSAEQAATSKNERMERRELLYIVVRDAMVCAGVLSASYKFKVLSLDPRGQQFLVMMDLAREFAGESARLSEIETLIAQTAKARYAITVMAVYWRINEQMAASSAPRAGAAPAAAGHTSHAPAAHQAHHPVSHAPHGPSTPQASGAGLRAPDPARSAAPPLGRPSMPAPLERPSAPAPVRLVAPRFEPIEADEVAAFKQALAAAAAARAPAAPMPGVPLRSGPRRPASPSDFPDTVMPEQDSRAQSLSNTQYGEL